MFKLLRRISGSFTTRLDREWNDDATSNAPQVGKKRRMSEDDDEMTGSVTKRSRGQSVASVASVAIPEESEAEASSTPLREESSASTSGTPAPPAKETEEVRQVTKGVKEVELEEKGSEKKAEALVPDGPTTDTLEASAAAEPSEEGSTQPVEEAKIEAKPSEDEASPEKESDSLERPEDDSPAEDALDALEKPDELSQMDSKAEASVDTSPDAENSAEDFSAPKQLSEKGSTAANSVPAPIPSVEESDEVPSTTQK